MADAHIAATPRIKTSTLSKHLRTLVEPIYREDSFMAGLKSHGRITYNNGGDMVKWYPRFRRRTINAGDGLPASTSFPVTNTKKIATLPWRKYDLGESLMKMERLMNQGDSRLFNLAETVINEVAGDFIEDLRLKLYSNGYATNSKEIMGLESMFRNSESLISGSFCAAPNNTYAELNSTLANYGGDWTGNWPVGTGDAEYCFWTPMIIDTKYASFGTTNTWAGQWQYVLNAMMTYQQILQRSTIDFLLLNSELLRQAKDSLQSGQRFEITQNSKITTETGVKTLSFEGLELSTEYGVPSNVGYGLRWKQMELMSMQKQLIDTSRDEDITTSTDLIALDSYLQLKCTSPAFFCKLMEIS